MCRSALRDGQNKTEEGMRERVPAIPTPRTHSWIRSKHIADFLTPPDPPQIFSPPYLPQTHVYLKWYYSLVLFKTFIILSLR